MHFMRFYLNFNIIVMNRPGSNIIFVHIKIKFSASSGNADSSESKKRSTHGTSVEILSNFLQMEIKTYVST